MKRDEVLRTLAANRENLCGFSVKSLAVFGSVARDEALPGSDVDLLVEFSEPVDLVTPDALKDRVRENILKEAIRAA